MWLVPTTIRHQCPFSHEPGSSGHIISRKLDGDAAAAADGSRDGGATDLLTEGSTRDLHIVETTIST